MLASVAVPGSILRYLLQVFAGRHIPIVFPMGTSPGEFFRLFSDGHILFARFQVYRLQSGLAIIPDHRNLRRIHDIFYFFVRWSDVIKTRVLFILSSLYNRKCGAGFAGNPCRGYYLQITPLPTIARHPKNRRVSWRLSTRTKSLSLFPE